jgi:hypothetical protein
LGKSYVHLTSQKGSSGKDDGVRVDSKPQMGDNTYDTISDEDQIVDGLLKYSEVGLVLQCVTNGLAVEGSVCLDSRGAYSRAFARVQGPELNSGMVCGQGHDSSHGVDFPDQMAFTNSTDGRITGHLAETFNTLCEEQSTGPGSRRSECCLGSGVPATNYDNVKAFHNCSAYQGT